MICDDEEIDEVNMSDVSLSPQPSTSREDTSSPPDLQVSIGLYRYTFNLITNVPSLI